MKKLVLLLIRLFADDRDFRINVSKELHRNAQNYYGEQTGYGRFYEACGEFFEAAPQFMNPNLGSNKDIDVRGGVMQQFDITKDLFKPYCPLCNRLMRYTWGNGADIYECVWIHCTGFYTSKRKEEEKI